MREVKDEGRDRDPEVKTGKRYFSKKLNFTFKAHFIKLYEDLFFPLGHEGHVPEIVLEKEGDLPQEIEKGHHLVTGDHVPKAIHNQRKNAHVPKILSRIPKIDIHNQNRALHQRNVHILESGQFLMTGKKRAFFMKTYLA